MPLQPLNTRLSFRVHRLQNLHNRCFRVTHGPYERPCVATTSRQPAFPFYLPGHYTRRHVKPCVSAAGNRSGPGAAFNYIGGCRSPVCCAIIVPTVSATANEFPSRVSLNCDPNGYQIGYWRRSRRSFGAHSFPCEITAVALRAMSRFPP